MNFVVFGKIKDEVEVGSIVKVSDHFESFWVIVKKIEGDVITGAIDNNLINEDYSAGDLITFKFENIRSIYKDDEETV